MKHFGLKYDKVYVADASDTKKGYADALVASAIAGRTGSALILTDRGNSKYTQNAINHIKENKNDKTEVEALGGNAVMPEEVVNGIKDAVKADSAELAAAKKAVKAYEDAKLDTAKDIEAAEALGKEATNAVKAVKDQAQREALEAKIAAQDKKVADAKAKLAFKVESVTAINETAIQIKGLAKEVKEADLVGKKIILKAGDVELTATYVATSLTEDGKANFVLENGKKLTDAVTYTVSSDWASFNTNTFMAKGLKAPSVNKVEVLTKGVPAVKYIPDDKSTTDTNEETGITKVYFTAKNQYGEDMDIPANNNLEAKATLNGVPMLASEVVYDKVTGKNYVEIKKTLAEGNKISLTLTNKINDKDVEIGSAAYTVVKAEEAVATTISDMKAMYANAENNHIKDAEAKEVMPGDQIKLTVKVNDQFGNPMDKPVRWVVEEGKDLINGLEDVTDAKDVTLTASKAGKLKISAYIGNGEKVAYEVMVGAKALNTLDLADEAGTRFNQDENIVKVVAPNSGANLTADMIKFDVKATKTSVDVTPADVKVTAKVRGGNNDANKNDIVIVAKSSKPGKYTITPYVGESLEKAIAKGNTFDVTTTIDQTVTSIDDINFDAAELKTGSEIKKDIIFRNRHKEVIVVNDAKVTVTPDSGMTADVIKDTDKNKNMLNLKATEAKNYNVVVSSGDVIRAFNLTFKAPAFTAVELGNDINGVVAGDNLLDKAKYQEIKFLDQDGKAMDVKKKDIKVSVTDPTGQPLDDISKLITLGKDYTVDQDGKVDFVQISEGVAGDEEAVVAIKVSPADITPGTYTIKVEDKDGKISDTLNITVGSKRIAKTVEIKPAATKVVLGGDIKVNIVPKDQYNEFINVGVNKISVDAGTNFTKSNVTEVKDEKDANKVIGYEVTLTGKTKGTNDFVVNVNGEEKDGKTPILATNKVSMTVDSAAGLIDSVAVDTKDIKSLYSTKDAEAKVDLNAIVKAADGTVIPVSKNDLNWKVISQKDAEGKEVSDKTITVDVKEEGVSVKAPKDTVGLAIVEVTTANMKKATITLKFDKEPSVAQKGTVEVINTAKDKDEKLLPLDADDKKEGIQISLDNDAKDGEKDGAVKVVLNAKDQYGNLFGDKNDQIKANEITLHVGDSSVVKAEAKDEDHKAVITITAKGEGDSKVYVDYAGQTIALDVTANKAAVEEAAKIEKAEKELKDAKDAFTSKVAEYKEANYTPESWTEFEKVVVAQTEIANKATTVEVVTAAQNTVVEEAKKLVTKEAQELENAKNDLQGLIDTANTAKGNAKISVDGSDVSTSEKWVTTEKMKALTDAIATADAALKAEDATAQSLKDAKTALENAITTFNNAVQPGTKA